MEKRAQLTAVGHPATIAAMLAVSLSLPAIAHADSYDYEIAVSYDATRFSSESNFGPPGGPVNPIRVAGETDDDAIGVAGTWYLDGVSASSGPRSRAAFISRASSVSVSYTRGNGDSDFGVVSTDPAFPSSTIRSEQRTNILSANLRWVWAESGWYGLAGLSRAELDFRDGDGSFSSAVDGDGYNLGVGKYLGAQTALELRVLRQSSDASGVVIGGGSSSTEVAVNFLHIGSLGSTWQYGTDIALATTSRGASEGSYNARLSLYPSRPLAFGIDIAGALQDTSDVSTDYEVFASWFPRDRLGLSARYGWIGLDELGGTDIDQYSFGIDVTFRF